MLRSIKTPVPPAGDKPPLPKGGGPPGKARWWRDSVKWKTPSKWNPPVSGSRRCQPPLARGPFGASPKVPAKIKRPCLHKETKAQTSAVPLFLPGKSRPLKSCPVTGASGGAYCSSALSSKVMFTAPSRPPCTKRRLSSRLRGGYLSFSARLSYVSRILYGFPGVVKRNFTFGGVFFRPPADSGCQKGEGKRGAPQAPPC